MYHSLIIHSLTGEFIWVVSSWGSYILSFSPGLSRFTSNRLKHYTQDSGGKCVFLPSDSWGMGCDWALILLLLFLSPRFYLFVELLVLLFTSLVYLYFSFHVSLLSTAMVFLLSKVVASYWGLSVRRLHWSSQAVEENYITTNSSNNVYMSCSKSPWTFLHGGFWVITLSSRLYFSSLSLSMSLSCFFNLLLFPN